MKHPNDRDRTNTHSPYMPGSAYEDPDFQRVGYRIIGWSGAIYFLLAYGLSIVVLLAPSGKEIADRLASGAQTLGLPAVGVRYQDLSALDGVSAIAYIVSLLVGVAVGLGFMVWMVVAYERRVIRPRHFEPIDRRAWQGWALISAGFAFTFWLLYLKDVHLAGNPYPGMGGIFIFPFFPVVASIGPLFLGFFGLLTFAGLRKAML